MTARRTLRAFGRTLVIEHGGQATQWPWTSITLSRQRPRPHACGAKRPYIKDPGWKCTGEDLVVPLDKSGNRLETGRIPVVIRADLIPRAEPAARQMIREGGTEPFHGGDHYHLMIEPEKGQSR